MREDQELREEKKLTLILKRFSFIEKPITTLLKAWKFELKLQFNQNVQFSIEKIADGVRTSSINDFFLSDLIVIATFKEAFCNSCCLAIKIFIFDQSAEKTWIWIYWWSGK